MQAFDDSGLQLSWAVDISSSIQDLFIVVDDNRHTLLPLEQGLIEQGQHVVYLDHTGQLNALVSRLEEILPKANLSSIHLFTHGQEGEIFLGSDIITGKTIGHYQEDLRSLGTLLSQEGDLLIYGCDVGKGSSGQSLIQRIAKTTGADVAASTDISGSSLNSEQADWVLERQTGDIETNSLELLESLQLKDIALTPFSIGAVAAGALVGWFVDWALDSATGRSNITLNWPESSGITPPSNAPSITTGIQPGQAVKSAYYLDTDGDLVNIQLTGPGTFALELAGGLSNNADATSLVLDGTTEASGLSISVSPLELEINAGSVLQGDNGLYNRMFSGGYTNLDTLSGIASNESSLNSIELSGVIVNNIDLDAYAIGDITLDTGFTTYVDRVNTSSLYNALSIESGTNFSGNQINSNTNNQAEVVDFAGVFDDQAPALNGGSSYNPVTGLIGLGDITAKSIGSLVINGSISGPTGDPYDSSFSTNDFRGEIKVSGDIGSIEAVRSRLNGSITAASIGSIDLGRIDGSITTTNKDKSLTLQLPYNYQGFLTSAGHLNLAYTFEMLANTAKGGSEAGGEENNTTGEIRSLGGISGVFPEENDTIYVPDQYIGVVINRSESKAIADININGIGMSRWISKADIGNITANAFTEAMIVEADKSIGNIETYLLTPVAMAEPPQPPDPPIVEALGGFFQAGDNIGNVKSATSVSAELRALKGSIGNITALTEGIYSNLIDANLNIGNLWAHNQIEANNGKIVARQGNIGDLYLGSGRWGASLSAKEDIGNIYVEKGGLETVTFSAGRDIKSMTVKGTNAVQGGTFSAGRSIGSIDVIDPKGFAVQGALFQAGDEHGLYQNSEIASIGNLNVRAYGGMLLPAIEVEAGAEPPPEANINPTDGIINTQIIAGAIGDIKSRAFTGNGIVDTVIHAKQEDVGKVTGIGNGEGMRRVNITAQRDLGAITGLSHMQGDGIYLSRFYANQGRLGLVTGRGGVAGGRGISETYAQSKGRSDGFVGISNSNGGHAIELLTSHAGSYGVVEGTVRGGEAGTPTESIANAIFESEFTSYEGNLERLAAVNHSINGQGIVNSVFDISGAVGSIESQTYNNTSIFKTEVIADKDIGSIQSRALHAGTGIFGSLFRSKKGSIGTSPDTPYPLDVVAGGGAKTDHGIDDSEFMAYENIGRIQVESAGGSAILASTFDADHDLSTGGFRNLGNIGDIRVVNKGIYPAESHGISGSNFTAANLGNISVDIEEFRGGAGILNSNFSARTAIYDETTGAFDNDAKIGGIVVRNASRTGNGIESSNFVSGASGAIKSIDVDTTWKKINEANPFNRGASGKAVYLSSFRASGLDPDQAIMNGKIGPITIRSGRVTPELVPTQVVIPGALPPNDQFTGSAAGIDLSYFAAYGGIEKIDVNSIGTGIFGSAFLANQDIANGPAGAFLASVADVKPNGSVGSVSVRANGRWSSGVVLSAVVGDAIGPVKIQARNGPLQPTPPAQLLQKQQPIHDRNRLTASGNTNADAKRPVLPIINLISSALQSTGLNPALQVVSPKTLQEYSADNLMRYTGLLNVKEGAASDFTTTGNLRLVNSQMRSKPPTPQPIDLGYAPVSGSLFVANKKSIGETTITNLNGGSPFFGSLFYAKDSYGLINTVSKAHKNKLDPAIEKSLANAGFKPSNSFSRYFTAFIGKQVNGGNLPRV